MDSMDFTDRPILDSDDTESQIWKEMEMDDMTIEIQTDMIAKSPTFTYSCPSVGGCNTATCATTSNTSCSC